MVIGRHVHYKFNFECEGVEVKVGGGHCSDGDWKV